MISLPPQANSGPVHSGAAGGQGTDTATVMRSGVTDGYGLRGHLPEFYRLGTDVAGLRVPLASGHCAYVLVKPSDLIRFATNRDSRNSSNPCYRTAR
jgi:hypothetical protein